MIISRTEATGRPVNKLWIEAGEQVKSEETSSLILSLMKGQMWALSFANSCFRYHTITSEKAWINPAMLWYQVLEGKIISDQQRLKTYYVFIIKIITNRNKK